MIAFYALMCCVGLGYLLTDLVRTVAAYSSGEPAVLDVEEIPNAD